MFLILLFVMIAIPTIFSINLITFILGLFFGDKD